MVTGGAEAAITHLGLGGFCALRALSTRNDEPEKASRPFDANRDGFVIGEGSAIMILEELERAKKRGANIYAEIAGYGRNADAFHIIAPIETGETEAYCMKLATNEAGINDDELGYINAHGTSTPLNDKTETKAIKAAFGEANARQIPISSTKSMIGHLLGAAGAMEGVATVLTLYNGIIPPTINYETPDPECDLDYVPNAAREVKVHTAISNSFAFGGHNATLAFRKFE
jgi:3-oxoacyl-[acyl-carrier-protein] synthase II